jgi:hypothetical protein
MTRNACSMSVHAVRTAIIKEIVGLTDGEFLALLVAITTWGIVNLYATNQVLRKLK